MDNKNISTPESKRNTGKQEYGNEIVDDAELKKGMKVEAEHKGLIDWLKSYMTERGEFPDDETIFAQIAKAHLEESPEYYKKLVEMEKTNTRESKRNEGARLYGSRENAQSSMDLFLKKSDFKNPGDEGTVGDSTFKLIRKTGRTNPDGDEQWEVEIIRQK